MLPNEEQVDHAQLVSHYCKILMPELRLSSEARTQTALPSTVINMQPVPRPQVSQTQSLSQKQWVSPFEVRKKTRQQQKILLRLNKINNKALLATFDE